MSNAPGTINSISTTLFKKHPDIPLNFACAEFFGSIHLGLIVAQSAGRICIKAQYINVLLHNMTTLRRWFPPPDQLHWNACFALYSPPTANPRLLGL